MFYGSIAGKGLEAFTAWVPREGTAATFMVEVISVSGGTLTVQIQHKDTSQSDADTPLDLGSTFNANSVDIFSTRQAGIKELVRFKFTVGGTNNTDWTCFRALPIAWERD